MRCAVVDKDGNVINVIVADNRTDAIPGMRLVNITSNTGIEPGDKWSEERGLHMSAERETRVFQSDAEHQAKIARGKKLTDHRGG